MKAITETIWLIRQQWALFTAQDGIEIFFFAIAFYYVAQWLKKDRTQPLLGYFYAYLALLFSSYFCALFSISFVLLVASAPIAMIFILLHQQTLQRNYIALRNLTPRKHAHTANWVELVVRGCLVAINNKKAVMCVIEQRDSLSQFIWAPFILQSYVQPGLLEFLLINPDYEQQSFLWLNHEGKLNGIQCNWEQFGQEQFTSIWHEDALLFTAKTDAVVLYADPATHTFSIIAQDKLIENLSAPQAVRIINSYVVEPHKAQKGAREYYEKNNSISGNQPTA